MLHYDHYYTIGSTHTVCEDYIIQGAIPTPFIVLSDGCSSSNSTDVGAQILALTTKQILENSEKWPLNYLEFGHLLINTTLKVVAKLKLPEEVLDATVMLAFLEQDNIVVYVYGDGCLLTKEHNGKINTIEIEFIHNAPYYLTYWNNRERLLEYATYEPNPLILKDSIHGKSELKPFQTQLVFRFPLKKFEYIAITSDGACQCIDFHQQHKIPLQQVANDLLKFKDVTDNFVKLNTKKILQQYAQQTIYPVDDFSIGVFANV
ncbi:protein phosphatase 2C domain-containing protein [Candidatus Halobeggiatoa sp. HSG11]|nr:protein phosphatase 2C domain-containing protein [Candidatus Halobeggiatoa sp. HSG11]